MAIFSCTSSVENNQAVLETEDFASSVAFLEVNAKPLSSDEYIVELVVKSFAKNTEMPEVIGYGEHLFSDDGLGNDLKANDGIYTTIETLTPSKSFEDPTQAISLMAYPRITDAFEYQDEFNDFVEANYSLESARSAVPDCRIILCGCDICNCLACRISDGAICWTIEQLPCGITIEL